MTKTTSPRTLMPDQRRTVFACLRVLVALALVLGVYAALPSSPNNEITNWVTIFLGLGIFVAVLTWQIREVAKSSHPIIRAVEALGITISLFLILFSTQYVAESAASSEAFSEPLDKFSGLYYTVTVFSTVGFGDITPVSHVSRGLTMVQMLGNLIILGVGIRVLTSVAQESLQRKRATKTSEISTEVTGTLGSD